MMLCEDEIARVSAELDRQLKTDPVYRNLLKVKGIGPVLAPVFVAEIGDVSRVPTAKALTCWAGLTPRHHESDRTVRRGTSANKDAHWSGGRRWRRSNANVSRQ
jgi:transposase